MGWKPHNKFKCGAWTAAFFLLVLVTGIKATLSSKKTTDTDLVFEDLPYLTTDDENNDHRINLVSKRSISSDKSVADTDVQDVLSLPNEYNDHWLWGSVKRIQRSIDKFLGTENSTDINKKLHKKKEHKKHKIHDKNSTSKFHRRKLRKHSAKKFNKTKENRLAFYKTPRPKRQDDLSYDDNEEEGYEDDIDDNEVNGSGIHSIIENEIENETPEKKERLFRVILSVHDPWHPKYEDKGSAEFQEFSNGLTGAIESAYKNNTTDENDNIFGRVVQIKQDKENRHFHLIVTVDITSNNRISGNELKNFLRRIIENNSKIGEYTVVMDRNFQFMPIIGRADAEDKWFNETNTIDPAEDIDDDEFGEDEDEDENDYEPRNCLEEQFECASDHICISLEKYCDYNNDCADGSDEALCASTPAPITATPESTDEYSTIAIIATNTDSTKDNIESPVDEEHHIRTPEEIWNENRRIENEEGMKWKEEEISEDEKVYEDEEENDNGGKGQDIPIFTESNRCTDNNEIVCEQDPHITICSNQVCDGNPDCPSGEDEQNCTNDEKERRAEEERRQEEEQLREDARRAEHERHQEEDDRRAEYERRQEDERRAEYERRQEDERRAEQERLQEEDARRDEDEPLHAENENQTEDTNGDEFDSRQEEERRAEDERRQEDERRAEYERRQEDERRAEDERRQEDERRVEDERRQEEERRAEDELRQEEERRDEDDTIIENAEETIPNRDNIPVHGTTSYCRGDDIQQCQNNPDINICAIQFCDGNRDCPDGEDELNCPTNECNSNEFSCDVSRCIPESDRCNNKFDCTDETDEQNCPPAPDCAPNEFKCRDGACISHQKVCNGIPDCPTDDDDESNCDCATNEFKCGDGTCILKEHICDGRIDCHDGTDESDCQSNCQHNEFHCNDGSCINSELVCNDVIDCADGEDEYICSDDEDLCTDDEFLCDNDKCILRSQQCDGFVDCQDHTDELNCSDSHQAHCQRNEFQCSNGLCIDSADQCNGISNCLDGSDEERCDNCQSGAFHCGSNECIEASKRCDKIHDCHDLSDEINCEVTTTPNTGGTVCGSGEWQCDNGECINAEFVCDGTLDCADKSDEAYSCVPGDTTTEGIVCRSGEWKCNNDECINVEFVCDGMPNCADHSDEEPSFCPPPVQCGANEFKCYANDQCIDLSQKCDGYIDCEDNSDELDCPRTTTSTSRPLACPEYKCPSEEKCFVRSDRCNGRFDCNDGYDEQGCPQGCRSGEFQCNDGSCIPDYRKCDQSRDCRDGSDEQNCHAVCRPDQWQCSSGECIPYAEFCDGRPNCRDNSDERNCNIPPPNDTPRLNLKTYPSAQSIKESREVVFQCRDEGPIRARVRWVRPAGRPLPSGSRDKDGRLEIPNIKMEHDGEYICEAVGYPSSTPGSQTTVHLTVEKFDRIGDRPPSACSENEATCMNGDCIPRNKICDGVYDCTDGSDESACSKGACEPNEFKCGNRKCILKTWRCDGEKDCEDNSDEENCVPTSTDSECRFDEFQCRTGQCVPKSFQCDTQVDCQDNSDEIGCTTPTVAQPPPPMVTLLPGSVFNISCRAVGVPVPLIVWRLNWGHVPEKCTSTSKNGFGVLTCPNIEVKDSGAYSCEIINTMGTHFVTPDTILFVNGNDTVCKSGYFNSKAKRPEDCINCFCFGVSTQCSSADLYTYSLPPPVTSLTVVGVVGPWNGAREITVTDFKKHDLIATRHGVQLRLSNMPLSREYPYYSLPEDYQGNQLKSYGGLFRYDIEYDGHGSPNDAPDVVVTGNGYTLVHRTYNRIEAGIRNSISVAFSPGNWYLPDGRQASREEIMMTLASVQTILIKLQYVDQVQREVELLNVVMDSAANHDMGLGSASLVEQCRCPIGYSGLSCESCDYGYARQQAGAWLGRCVAEVEACRPGTYGDPNRGIACKACPCPLSTSGNNFATTCSLSSDGEVVCECDRGYTGRRCEQCERGYIGNPLLPGGSCQPEPVSNCDNRGTARISSDGRCFCKEHVTGVKCDQCAQHSFFLNPNSETGCIDCFCMGVTKACTSSSWFRDSIRATFSSSRNEYAVITDYENPDEVPIPIDIANNEVSFRGSSSDTNVYYWRLPARFAGNKLTAYGGNLNYTVRYVPNPGGFMSRNNAPDVVIRSLNDITILHYRHDEVSPSGSQSYHVPILEGQWQRSDGNKVNREHLLMALADVSDIFIKATYTTITEEAALSHINLDTASQYNTGSYVRAVEVEQCSCPPGHQGLSCEDCAPGYTRSDRGLYLALCKQCECNGHSNECDPETGVCENCRDNTYGDNCEICSSGFYGNATNGTPRDCTEEFLPEPHTRCEQCDPRGYLSCDNGCRCKANVVGYRCDQCREGTFNLKESNPLGCSECFCSGVTRACSSSRLYREQIPMIIFEDKFTLTNRLGDTRVQEEPHVDIATNEFSQSVRNGQTLYWSLPSRFLGNQILSYGGTLNFTIRNDGYGNYVPDQDIILTGNGLTLFWTRRHQNEGANIVRLTESEWQSIDRNGPRPASQADLLTVLSKLQSILIRATLKETVTDTYISDVSLDTGVQQQTQQQTIDDIEVCLCPEGYRGTSCETCDHFYYHDTYDRSAGLVGTCKRCPCTENAESCTLDYDRSVICNCKPGYYGSQCSDSMPPVVTSRPPPTPPTISVVISTPVLQIVDVGNTVQLACSGYHIVKKIPITVRWHKQDGRLPVRAYEEQGTLIITNVQYDDSGVYICQAQSGGEVAEQHVTITVGGESPATPKITLSPPYIETDEFTSPEVQCQSSGSSPIHYTWEKLNGLLTNEVDVNQGYLRFNSIRKSDEGDYRCSARNNWGDDSQILRVVVRSPTTTPPRPQYVEINPPSFTGRPGDEVRLTCSSQIEGNVFWNKTGLQILPPSIYVNRGILLIRSARVEDSGQYICTSGHASSTADVFITTQSDPPKIKHFNDVYNIIQGQDFSLNCEASGNPKIKWTKVYEPFESNVQQNGNILHILNAQPPNRGVYTCIAESDGGTAEKSTVIDIEPREPPLLELYPPEPQTIRVGESAMLSCRVSAGIPQPSIIWTRRDRRPLSLRIKEEYPGIITFRDVTFEESGDYECSAENIAGKVTITATLNIHQSPVITLKPDVTELTLTEGDELNIECTAQGTPQPNVEWMEPQQQATPYGQPRGIVQTNVPNAVIQKYNIRRSDEGTYICHATNSAGAEEKYITVLVQPKRGDAGAHDRDEPYYPYNQTPRPDDYSPTNHGPKTLAPYKVTVGDKSEISCNFEHTPKQTSWRRVDGRPLPRGSHLYGGVLVIDDTTQEAAGFYECTVTEQNIEFPIATTEIIVIELPRITFSPSMPMTVRSGDNVVIYCNVTGEQPIRVQWHNENFRPLPISVSVRGSYLQFSHITPNDAGRYYCTAVNIHGNVTKVAEVIVNRNEIIDQGPDQQGRVQEVIEGQTVSLDCSSAYEQTTPGVRFNWRREYGEIPPSATFDRNSRLILHRITQADAGRYICQMTTYDNTVTHNYVDVVLKRYELITTCSPNDFKCKSHPNTCIDQSMVCDGIYDCVDHSDEMECYGRHNLIRSKKDGDTAAPSKIIAAERLPFLKLEPTRSYLRPGDSINVDCTSSSGSYAQLTWERQDGQRLPYNIKQEGSQLIITNAQSQDSGLYKCKCITEEGYSYSSEYELNIEVAPTNNEIRPPKVENAEIGSTVVLRCNSDKYPSTFYWTRQHGQFASGQDISGSELRLVDVQSNDAGTYICTTTSNGNRLDIPTTLVVTGAIPYFPQAPKSYIVFPTLPDAYMKFNFEITFKPERANGLILYNGQKQRDGDFISLSLNNGHPEFRFDYGSEPAIVRSDKRIELSQWHTIKVNRIRKDGFMIVDDQHPVAFPPQSRIGLDLIENLYLGGVPNYNDIAPSALAQKEGFVGCISRLILKDRMTDLNKDSLFVEGTTSCEPCADDPCHNEGVCLESQTETGYACVCQEGFTGRTCNIEGISCSIGICGTGRCEDTDIGMECYCPLNKTGDRCQYIEHLDESNLSFKVSSFAAYRTPKSTKLNIKFRVRPENTENGVILYVAESEHANGDFAAVIVNDKHYEFRFNLGARVRPVIIRSEKPVVPNKWTEIAIGRRHGEGFMQIDDQPQVTGKTVGPARSMYLKTNLYIGGYDKRILLNKGVDVTGGFEGCISGLELSSQKVDMVADILDAANVQNCGESNEILDTKNTPAGDCRPGYSGRNCDKISNICIAQDPCDNEGICRSKGNEFTCDCPIGFTGDICQHIALLTQSAHFRGNGYIELNRSSLVKSAIEKDVLIAVLFSTTHPNGLLVWYGQNKTEQYNGQDFIALAIVDGFLEYSFRLNSEEAMIKNIYSRVDDGIRHVAIIKRTGNHAGLELDGLTLYGESRPTDKKESYLPGHLFIGGAPDLNNFTGNRYTQGFQGCIHIIEGTDDGAINLTPNTISGVNVDTCPDDDDERDLGTEPPVV